MAPTSKAEVKAEQHNMLRNGEEKISHAISVIRNEGWPELKKHDRSARLILSASLSLQDLYGVVPALIIARDAFNAFPTSDPHTAGFVAFVQGGFSSVITFITGKPFVSIPAILAASTSAYYVGLDGLQKVLPRTVSKVRASIAKFVKEASREPYFYSLANPDYSTFMMVRMLRTAADREQEG